MKLSWYSGHLSTREKGVRDIENSSAGPTRAAAIADPDPGKWSSGFGRLAGNLAMIRQTQRAALTSCRVLSIMGRPRMP